jgi:tetratricopeptide (TPR) repeat protein
MRRTIHVLALVVTSALALSLAAEDTASSLDTFLAARKAYDGAAMEATRAALIARAEAQAGDYVAQWEAAECLRITGSELRTQRQAQRVSGKEGKELRQLQESWSIQGLVFGDRAVALADSPERLAASHRVCGELYANSISGMVSGLKNGPKAKKHMDEALAGTPEDPECQRAIGIMYLNNPPFNGGDIEKAIATFNHCHELVPDNDDYLVLLAMAYQKNKDWENAMKAAESALAVNPANPNAAALKAAAADRTEAAE